MRDEVEVDDTEGARSRHIFPWCLDAGKGSFAGGRWARGINAVSGEFTREVGFEDDVLLIEGRDGG